MSEFDEKKNGLTTKEEVITPSVTQVNSFSDSEVITPIESQKKRLERWRLGDEEHAINEAHWNEPAETVTDFVTEIIHAEDDPTQNPWTFRTWFLGFGLSAFGAVLSTIYFFKPQSLSVSTIFLGCISYVLGELMSHTLPRRGPIGRFLNPHPVSNMSTFTKMKVRYQLTILVADNLV
jgi:hypothetical protein